MSIVKVVTLNNRELIERIMRIRETFKQLPQCCFNYTYYIDWPSLEPHTGDVKCYNSTAPALVFKILLEMLNTFKMTQ
jgi:hypothetical protein